MKNKDVALKCLEREEKVDVYRCPKRQLVFPRPGNVIRTLDLVKLIKMLR